MKPTRSVLLTGLVVGAVIGIALSMSATRRDEGADTPGFGDEVAASSPAEAAGDAPGAGQETGDGARDDAKEKADAEVATERPPALPVSVPAAVAASAGLPDFSTLAEALAPSVVNISTESEETEESDAAQQNPFERFMGPRRSLGSGFVFDTEGYIITNAHVVEDATKIVVRMHDEREFEAKVVGSDPKTDLAVIRIEGADNLVAVSLGDSDALKVGEWVLAIGNPFGLDHSLTAGIVSAKGRRISRRNPYDDFIQTDAAINPGNSGGPLVNLQGQVVGINSAIFSSGGGNIGIGFAIPVNMAREIVPQLRQEGHVTRGWLGVKIQPVDKDIANSLGLEEARGALVAEVFADSPAGKAGVEVGDVIIGFDGNDVEKSSDLPALVAGTPVGKVVELDLLRDGARVTMKVEVAKLDDDAETARPVRAEALGLSVQNLTPDMAAQLGLEKDASGVVVTGVKRGSPAAEAGLEPGDLIVSVANQPVETAEKLGGMLEKAGRDRGILVLIRRGDQTLFRVLKPESKDGAKDAPGKD